MSESRERVFDVMEHGAAGDGKAKDTLAIQKAIDACAAAGGGRVYCPPGTYLSGSLVLKSNVELHVEAGATVLGSPDLEDYHVPEGIDLKVKTQAVFAVHLICAQGERNVALTGRGAIDGNGRAFFPGPKEPGSTSKPVKDRRPGHMLAFKGCQDVLISDLHLLDSPCYSVWPLCCERVTIRGVTILNDREGPNTDGIDPDSCRDVVISDCIIHAGDDCIAIKSDAGRLDSDRPCENITVTNCVFSTPCCGVRIGYEGDAPIRNVCISNIVMRDTRTGINMLVPRDTENGIEHGPAIENVTFSNIVMDTQVPFFLWVGDDAAAPGGIRDISFSNIRATAERGCFFGGSRSIPMERVSIDGLDLVVRGEMDDEFGREVPDPYRAWGFLTRKGPNCKRGIPHALYFRDAREVSLRDVRVRWGEVSGEWRSAVRCEGVEALDVSGLVARGAPGPVGAPAVHLSGVKGAFLRGCRAEPGTGAFLTADGGTENVSALSCELSAAERAFDVPQGALFESGNCL